SPRCRCNLVRQRGRPDRTGVQARQERHRQLLFYYFLLAMLPAFTVSLFLTPLTPRTLRATCSARAFSWPVGTVPDKVTTPWAVSAMISGALVSRAAISEARTRLFRMTSGVSARLLACGTSGFFFTVPPAGGTGGCMCIDMGSMGLGAAGAFLAAGFADF